MCGGVRETQGALQRLFKSPFFVSRLFVPLSHTHTHTHTVNHTCEEEESKSLNASLYYVPSSLPLILSFYFQPFWTHKSAFCALFICATFLFFSCCSFIFIPLLLSFYSVFFLSLILSLPSLTWTLIINVSVRKRGKMCEISHRDFIIFCSRLECVLV